MACPSERGGRAGGRSKSTVCRSGDFIDFISKLRESRSSRIALAGLLAVGTKAPGSDQV